MRKILTTSKNNGNIWNEFIMSILKYLNELLKRQFIWYLYILKTYHIVKIATCQFLENKSSQPVQFKRIPNYLQFGSHVACLNDRTWKILNVHKRNQCKNWPISNVTLTQCHVRTTWTRWDWKFLRTCWTKDIIITFSDPKR